MSKAILVMDMPKNCMRCPKADFAKCRITKRISTGYFRPVYCPLRKIPQAQNSNGNYVKGYNDCIDEILKGSEEHG